jgi:hypothetical protein
MPQEFVMTVSRTAIARYLVTVCCLGLPGVAFAQAPNSGFEKGTRLLSVGAMTGGGYDGTGLGGIVEWGVANAHFPVRANLRLDLDTGVGFQLGARYRLASRLGVMGQIGLGDLPLVFAGASLRF